MQARRCVSAFQNCQSGDLAAAETSHLAIFVAERPDWVEHRQKKPPPSGECRFKGAMLAAKPPGIGRMQGNRKRG